MGLGEALILFDLCLVLIALALVLNVKSDRNAKRRRIDTSKQTHTHTHTYIYIYIYIYIYMHKNITPFKEKRNKTCKNRARYYGHTTKRNTTVGATVEKLTRLH
jgi:hypothetical protein